MAVKETAISRQSSCMFWSLVRHMPLHEFRILLTCGKDVNKVYAFDHISRSVFVPSDLPWPLEYLLGYHSPKHVLQNQKRVSLRTVGRALHDWEHRLRWKLVFSNHTPDVWQFLKRRSCNIAPCDIRLPSSVDNFCHDVRQTFYKEVLKARGKFRNHRYNFSNMYGVVRLALRLLDDGPFKAIRTDKDGGFALIQKSVVKHEILRILNNPSRYREIPWTPSFSEEIVRGFASEVRFHLPFFMDDDEKSSFWKNILQPLRGRASHAVSKLKFTIKTHKGPGKVEFRGIHASVNTPFSGAFEFIASLLRPFLSSLKHLLKNSEALVKKLFSLPVSQECRFVKIDIKEYFMEGSHSQFLEYSAPYVAQQWRRTYKHVLQYVLDSQYVEADLLNGRLWKVLKGAGMGLGFSGELCDTTFYSTVERDIVDRPDVLRRHFVELYVRYRDDILILHNGSPDSLKEFLRILRNKSSVWKLEIESISQDSCDFLDLFISKGAKWRSSGLLDVGIFHKPTSLHQPLAPHSMHSCHVHKAWPKGLVARAKKLCNTKSGIQKEVAYIKKLLSARCGTIYADQVLSNTFKQLPRLPCHDLFSRVLIPYHREWDHCSVRAVLHKIELQHNAALKRDLSFGVKVQLCFGLPAPHLYVRLDRCKHTDAPSSLYYW